MDLVIPSVEGYVEKINNSDNTNLIITLIDNNYDDGNVIASPIGSIIDRNIVISSIDKISEVLNKLNKLWKDIEDKINASI